MIEKLGKCFFSTQSGVATAFLSGMKLTPAFTGHTIYFHKYLMIRARDPSTINIRICDDSDSDLDPATVKMSTPKFCAEMLWVPEGGGVC